MGGELGFRESKRRVPESVPAKIRVWESERVEKARDRMEEEREEGLMSASGSRTVRVVSWSLAIEG